MRPLTVPARMLTVVAIALFVGGAGCIGNIFGPWDKRPVKEDRGPLLASDVAEGETLHSVVWTADGSEIVYVAFDPASGAASLQGASIADGARRLVDTSRPASETPLARSADGSVLYYVIVTEGRANGTETAHGLREAISGKDIVSDVPPSRAYDLVLSPDGHRLLYSAQAGDLILDLERGTATASGCAEHPSLEPMPVFSPNSDRILCRRFVAPNAMQLAEIDVTDGTPQDLPEPAMAWRAARWDAAGIHMAGWDARRGGLTIFDPLTGESHLAYRPADDTDADIGTAAAFSPDGGKVGFWLEECLASSGLLGCDRVEEQLVVVDLVTGVARTIATGSPPAGAIAFSDDGRHIAYQFGSELHVLATAP